MDVTLSLIFRYACLCFHKQNGWIQNKRAIRVGRHTTRVITIMNTSSHHGKIEFSCISTGLAISTKNDVLLLSVWLTQMS